MSRLSIITKWVDIFDKILRTIYKTRGYTIINEINEQMRVIEKTWITITDDDIDKYNNEIEKYTNHILQIETCIASSSESPNMGIQLLFWGYSPHSIDEFAALLHETYYPVECFYDYTTENMNTTHGFDAIYNDYIMNYLFTNVECVYKELKRMYIPILLELSHTIQI